MKSHPRIRKTIKWGGAAVTVLLGVLWVGSGWWWLSIQLAREEWVHVLAGCIVVHDDHAPGTYHEPPSFMLVRNDSALRWWFHRAGWVDSEPYFLPLWPLAVAAAVVTIRAWHLDTLARRRARLNLCPKCKYDRAGLAAGAKCPECGATTANPT